MESIYSFLNNSPSDFELLDGYSKTVTNVVGTVSEAVVHIQVTKKIFERKTGKQQLTPASGSGFIISSDGFIITNDHVISNAEQIKVALSDGRIVPATLQGSDPSSDIAVLKYMKPPETIIHGGFQFIATRTDRHCHWKPAWFAAYGLRQGL